MESTFGIAPWITGIIVCSILFIRYFRRHQKHQPRILYRGTLYGRSIFPRCAGFDHCADQYVPQGLADIFVAAFDPSAVAGGLTGSFIMTARYGVARGVFSNEAGGLLRSATLLPQETDHPCRQGYVSMTNFLFDTIIICTMTGLAIASTGSPDLEP